MNNIRPFRFWCQKVLPLVYDDSLSYYELLCKVVAKLNEVIDGTNNVIEEWEQIKSWVGDYIKDEVDKKLDTMAEDGTLDEIINEKIFNELNQKVNTNTSDINNLKTNLTEVESKVQTNTNNISNLTQKTNTNEDNISKIEKTTLLWKQIDWFGDSLIRGETEGGKVVDKPIPMLFAEMTGANCINHAESGATIANNDWATKVINQVNRADLSNSDYIIVEGGINDYVLNYPIGDSSMTGSFSKGLVDIFNAIDAKNHNAKIIMCTLFPNIALFEGSLGHDGENFLNFNNAIKKICRDRCIRCIDMTYNSINYNYFNTVCPTGTHFTQEGYNILAMSMLNLITTAGTTLPYGSGNNLIKGAFPTMDLSDVNPSLNTGAYRHGNCIALKPGDTVYSCYVLNLIKGVYTLRFKMAVIGNGKATVNFGCETYGKLGVLNNIPGSSIITTFREYEITINPTTFKDRLLFSMDSKSTAKNVVITDITLCPGEVPCAGDECMENKADITLTGFNVDYPLQFKQRDRLVSFNGPVQSSQEIEARTTLVDLSNYNFAKGKYCPASAVIFAADTDGNVYPLLLDFETYKLENLKTIPADKNLGVTAVIDIS